MTDFVSKTKELLDSLAADDSVTQDSTVSIAQEKSRAEVVAVIPEQVQVTAPVAESPAGGNEKRSNVIPTQVPVNKVRFPKPDNKITYKFIQKVIPWVELHWLSKGRYPTAGEFQEQFGFTLEEVDRLNLEKRWILALERRGIPLPNLPLDYLSPKQIAAIAVLTNFHDTRHPNAKMASLGISADELQGWYRNPVFARAIRDRSDEALDNVSVDANLQLANLIKRGDFRAIKFYFEITGKTQNQETVDVKQAMQILVEAVQKNVHDPKVLEQIAAEVNSIRGLKGL